MRPLELSFSGLRSYTEFGPISFEDKSLVGILGDTGAGKSTILEALCVALYGKCSWSERDVKDLIADGARSMSVDFRFTHDGHTWRIRRTYYANTIPSTVLLENLDTHAKFDNARPVDAQIVSMLRLDFTAFKSAVLLPQGRFQTLLHASGRERADLLSGIFGADVIDAVRSLISTRQTALADLVRDAEVARARLRDHPAIAAEDARIAAENAEGRYRALMNSVEALRAAQREAGSTETLAKSLHHTADAAGSAAAQLDEIRPVLADVLIAAANIEKSRLSLDTREKQAQVQREQAEAALRAAHDAREGPEDLGRAAGTLTGLGARLDDLTHLSHKIQAEQTRLDAEDLRLTDAANAEPALAANAKRLTVTAGHLAERLEAARTAASNLRERLQEALTSAVTDVICSRDARELEKQIAEVETRLPALRTSAGITAAAHSDAVGVLRATQRDEAAATIGAHLHPGDACPVCTATLPDGYTPPFPTDPETHTAAETEEERARRAALDAAQALRDAERDLTQLRERAHQAAEKASIATREADRNADAALTAAADRALTDTVPEPDVEGISTPEPIHPEQLHAALIASIEALAVAEDPEASLGRAAVEKLLVDIVAFGAALKNAHADTDGAATAAQTRWTRLQAEHAAARQAYDRDRQALAHARQHVTELRSGMAKDLHTLPSSLTEVLPVHDANLSILERVQMLRAALPGAENRLAQRRRIVEQHTSAVHNAVHELTEASKERKDLGGEERARVLDPLRYALSTADRAAEVVSNGWSLLTEPQTQVVLNATLPDRAMMPESSTANTPATAKSYLEAVSAAVTQLTGVLDSATLRTHEWGTQQLAQLHSHLARALSADGNAMAPDLPQGTALLDAAALDPLTGAASAADHQARAARTEEAAARAEIERAAVLDAALDAGRTRCNALAASVARTLTLGPSFTDDYRRYGPLQNADMGLTSHF